MIFGRDIFWRSAAFFANSIVAVLNFTGLERHHHSTVVVVGVAVFEPNVSARRLSRLKLGTLEYFHRVGAIAHRDADRVGIFLLCWDYSSQRSDAARVGSPNECLRSHV